MKITLKIIILSILFLFILLPCLNSFASTIGDVSFEDTTTSQESNTPTSSSTVVTTSTNNDSFLTIENLLYRTIPLFIGDFIKLIIASIATYFLRPLSAKYFYEQIRNN